MTQLTAEASPFVELQSGLDLSAAEVAALTAANSTADPEKSFREAIIAYRMWAIRHSRDHLLNKTVFNDGMIRYTLDTAWQLYMPVFKNATGPMIAEAYIRAWRDVQDGAIPIELIYTLAEDHAARVGAYFNSTSTDALIQGFNTFVNRQVPQRAAMEQVLDAYGLTPRQMTGYVNAKDLKGRKVESKFHRRAKTEIKAYIGKSIADRLNVFQRQEAHNLGEHARQVAWMWMVENNKLPANAQKMWLTARDEKVCKQCGPMHRTKVKVGEQFTLPDGNKLYVPGAHVNCRCETRLQINPFEAVNTVSKADGDFDPKQHPRGGNPRNRGQFSRVPPVRERPTPTPAVEDIVRAATEQEMEAPPAVETPPEKPSISIGTQPSTSTPTPVSDKPSISIAPRLDRPSIRISPDIVPQGPPSTNIGKPDLNIGKPTLNIGKPSLNIGLPDINVGSTEKPSVNVNYERLLRLQSERQTADQRTTLQPSILQKIRPITDANGVPSSAYIIGNADDLTENYRGTVALTDAHELTVPLASDTATWQQQAIKEEYNKLIDEYFRYMMNAEPSYSLVVEDWVTEDGDDTGLNVEVPPDVVLRAIKHASMRSEDDVMGDADFTLLGHTSMGEEVEYHTNYNSLIRQMGIKPDDFQVVMVSMDAGYADAVPVKRDNTRWIAPGAYTASNERRMVWMIDGQPIPFLTIRATPLIEEETTFQYLDDFPPS